MSCIKYRYLFRQPTPKKNPIMPVMNSLSAVSTAYVEMSTFVLTVLNIPTEIGLSSGAMV